MVSIERRERRINADTCALRCALFRSFFTYEHGACALPPDQWPACRPIDEAVQPDELSCSFAWTLPLTAALEPAQSFLVAHMTIPPTRCVSNRVSPAGGVLVIGEVSITHYSGKVVPNSFFALSFIPPASRSARSPGCLQTAH